MREVIENGNAGRLFKVWKVKFLQGEPTRWDSAFYMSSQFLQLLPVRT